MRTKEKELVLEGDEKNHTALGKTFLITAVNEKGEIAIRQILDDNYTEKEKVIMQVKQASNVPLSCVLFFTPAAILMSNHPRLYSKFKPFTIKAVLDRIIKKLKDFDATLFDVQIEILNEVREDGTPEGK